MNINLLRHALLIGLFVVVLIVGFTAPVYAGACEDACQDEWEDCYAEAEDWWGQCYQVCEALYYPHDPMAQAECQDECDIQQENDQYICDEERWLCIVSCQT